jgi:DNA recombination protein RmuC
VRTSPSEEPAVTTSALLVVALLAAGCAALGVLLWSVRRQQENDGAAADHLIATLRAELVAHHQVATDQAAVRHQQDLAHAIDTLVAVAGERLEARTHAGVLDLDGKKALIDAELQRMGSTLGQVTELVQRLDTERAEQLGEVREQLSGVTRTHAELATTASALREALTSSQARGQWGERMAEDVLTAAGFKHGVNYVTQRTLACGARPDVTFLLPGELCLHMDVKFPLTNYLAMLEAGGDADAEVARKRFLKDVRARIKELATRGYIDRAGGTLDCVLLFLPNEQVYGYVHEQDPGLLDDALRQGVVLCSPSTLFAVLAVVRQSCDSVALQRTSDEILALLAGFSDQWERYTEEVDKLGRQLETVGKTYDQVNGVRRRQLEKQLDGIEEARTRREVSPVVVGERPRLLRLPDGVDGDQGGDGPGLPVASNG